MKHVLIAAALLSLGGVAAGCGNDQSSTSADAKPTSSSTSPADAPSDASSGDLCQALSQGASIKDGADVASFADALQKAGTPTKTPSTARKGFEVYVGVLRKVDPHATATELKHMKNVNLSKTEQTEVQTFMGYAQQTCAPSTSSGGGAAAQ